MSTKPQKRSLSSLASASDLLKKEDAAPATELRAKIEDLIDHPLNRKKHDEEVIRQIAEDIKKDGDTREKIGVKPHPTIPGKYLIFSGHGRKKSYILAGKDDAAININENYDDFDLVKLNIQKSDQDPSDSATFIKQKLEEGLNKTQIAERLGVSNAWVTQHSNLIDLPKPLDKAFKSGRCTDVTLITELLKLYKQDPDKATVFIEDENVELTRKTVSTYIGYLKQHSGNDDSATNNTADDQDTEQSDQTPKDEGHKPPPPKNSPGNPDDILKIKKPLILVEYMGQTAHLMFKKRPQEGQGYIKLLSNGEEVEVPLEHLQITAIMDSKDD